MDYSDFFQFEDKTLSAKMELKNTLFIDEQNGLLDVDNAYKSLFNHEHYAYRYLSEPTPVDYRNQEDILFYRKQGQENTLWYFVECLYKKNYKSLENLTLATNEIEKATNFFTILHLVQLLSGPTIILKNLSGSDMWGVVEKGNLKDPIFAGLHYLNFFNHLKSGAKIKPFKFSDISNIYNPNIHKIGTEAKILDTVNKAAPPFVSSVIELLKMSYFDELLLEFFGEVSKGFESKSELLFYINNSVGGHQTSLISQKLESLGFSEG